MKEEGLEGCNVTLPYKETAYAVAKHKCAAARAVGAANTLWYADEGLTAENTDGQGFLDNLRHYVPGFTAKGSAVAVLGAGGAARAVINALLGAGAAEVHVFNRTRNRTDTIARHFGPKVRPHDWREREDAVRDASLLVNATSLGMKGGARLEMDLAALPSDCIVADLVYVPLMTPLLVAARERGLIAIDGLGMLLHQAVPGFEKWFGVRPLVTDELRDLVIADIEAN
jgi:shikimate dehydrogenase